MSDSGDDDLPVLTLGDVKDSRPLTIKKIDVDAEIAESFARKARLHAIKLEQLKYEEEKLDLPKVPTIQEPTISGFPPHRPIFDPERSLRVFDSGFLKINNTVTPPDNSAEFLPWFRSKFKDASADEQRELLKYLWLLLSCHSDPIILHNIYDLLIQFDACWRLKYDEILLVFINWGVPISDFVTDQNLNEIITSLEASPIVSASNVAYVLQVLTYQLRSKDLDGSKILRKPLSIVLTLLTLDHNYWSCVSDVLVCLDLFAEYSKEQRSDWIRDYCKGLLTLEPHHARVAYLAECIVPESMRWCLCLAFCQKFFELPVTYEDYPKPHFLRTILLKHVDDLIKHESYEVYSLISIVNCGISVVVSCETQDRVKRDFLLWLNEFMERKREQRKEDIDVDGTLIAELVSRLQAGWESSWLEEPQILEIEDSD